MNESEQLSRLIGDIYDAALDAALWPQVLEGARGFVGGHNTAFFWQDASTHSAGEYYQDAGLGPEYRQLYLEKYAPLNPLFPAGLFIEPEEVYASTDLMPISELRQTRFYKEWMRPQKMVDAVCANLEKSATSVACFSVTRGQRDGIADGEARRRMRLIVPHVRRAAAIGKVIDFRKSREAALSSIVDALPAAVFLLDARARIGYANTKGEAMRTEGDVVRATHGVLSAVEGGADTVLRDAILAAADGDAGIGVRGVAVPLTASRESRYIAHVLPLASRARQASAGGYTAAVFIRQVTLGAPSPLEVMAKLYKLTAGEVRVLQAVMQTSGIAALAQSLGISRATVKTHLNRLLAKTGSKRQADLVRLTAAHSGSLDV